MLLSVTSVSPLRTLLLNLRQSALITKIKDKLGGEPLLWFHIQSSLHDKKSKLKCLHTCGHICMLTFIYL